MNRLLLQIFTIVMGLILFVSPVLGVTSNNGTLRHIDELDELSDGVVDSIRRDMGEFPCVVASNKNSNVFASIKEFFIPKVSAACSFRKISKTFYEIDGKVYNLGDLTPDEIKNFDISKFRQGKLYEGRVSELFRTKDTKLFEDLASATGRSADELKNADHLTQVQFFLPDGGYVILDDIFVTLKQDVNGLDFYEIIVTDSKLTQFAPFTKRQGQFVDNYQDITTGLRSTRPAVTQVIDPNVPVKFIDVFKIYGHNGQDKIVNAVVL